MSRTKSKNGINNLGSSLAVIGITIIVGFVAVSVYTSEKEMRAQEKAYIERESDLNREIEEESQRTKELNDRKAYVKTKEYVKEVAKEKLGLLDPDEIFIEEKEQ